MRVWLLAAAAVAFGSSLRRSRQPNCWNRRPTPALNMHRSTHRAGHSATHSRQLSSSRLAQPAGSPACTGARAYLPSWLARAAGPRCGQRSTRCGGSSPPPCTAAGGTGQCGRQAVLRRVSPGGTKGWRLANSRRRACATQPPATRQRHAGKPSDGLPHNLSHLRAVAAGVQPALEDAVRVCAGVAALAGALHRSKERSSQGRLFEFAAGKAAVHAPAHSAELPLHGSGLDGNCAGQHAGDSIVARQAGRQHGRVVGRDRGGWGTGSAWCAPCGNLGRARRGT